MLTVVGRYTWESNEQSVSDEDFFVHCCGRYKLINLERFQTERPNGTANYQLLYVADGKAHFLINGEMRELIKGQCILYRPKDPQYYYYELKDYPDIYWVHFSCREGNQYLKDLRWENDSVFDVGSHGIYIKLFDSIIEELQLKLPYHEAQLKLYMQQLFVQMERNRIREMVHPSTENKSIEEAIQYFHHHSEKDFTIKEFVKEKGLNYYRFIDSFTKQVGLSPRQYIINIRMTKAKDLLVNSLFQIAEVAELTGYDNPLYFSRLFKKTWGMSPKEYKEWYSSKKGYDM